MVFFGGWTGASSLSDTWTLTLREPGVGADGNGPKPYSTRSSLIGCSTAWWFSEDRTGLSPQRHLGVASPAGRKCPASAHGNAALEPLSTHGDLRPGAQPHVVFGGYTASLFLQHNDTWRFLSGTPVDATLLRGRRPRSAIATRPSTIRRDRMVVFGGYVVGSLGNDAWRFLSGTPAWTNSPPRERRPLTFGPHAIYDPVRDRMVVFGGFDGGVSHSERRVGASSGTPADESYPSGQSPRVAQGPWRSMIRCATAWWSLVEGRD
jgi:hypothetical protein